MLHFVKESIVAFLFVVFCVAGLAGTVQGQATSDPSLVRGKICYKVKKDDSNAARRQDIEGEDRVGGTRSMRIKTNKVFIVCERALIDLNALQ